MNPQAERQKRLTYLCSLLNGVDTEDLLSSGVELGRYALHIDGGGEYINDRIRLFEFRKQAVDHALSTFTDSTTSDVPKGIYDLDRWEYRPLKVSIELGCCQELDQFTTE